MSAEMELPEGFTKSDIFFDCPGCGKSLGIDRRGAGLIVRCPDCGLRMQVPFVEDREETAVETSLSDYTPAGPTREISADAEVARLNYSHEDVEAHRQRLEKMQIDFLARFDRIREEIALIQAGLDRLVDILQGVSDRGPSERHE